MFWMLASCVSLVEVQNDWRTYLEQTGTCSVDADCAVIAPGCPLGCYAGVPQGFQAEALGVAAELADRYQQGLRPCEYRCGPEPFATCDLRTGICEPGGPKPQTPQ